MGDLLVVSQNERSFILGGVAANLRSDGRLRNDYRTFTVEVGGVTSAGGSARVKLDQTDVLVVIKPEVTQCDVDAPNCGKIAFAVECSASASPMFERRGADQLSAEISQVLRRLCTKGAVNLESLHIVGTTAWQLNVDVLVLECAGGNLLDSIALATKAALLNLRIPEVEITGDGKSVPFDFEIVDDPHQVRRLDVAAFPLVVTLTRVGAHHVLDASAEEEACAAGRTVVAVTPKGDIAMAHKGGAGTVSAAALLDVLQLARTCAADLHMALGRALEAAGGSK